MSLTVGVLRELFRGLQAFRSAYESDGIEEIRAPNGEEYSLFDIEYLYSQLHRLPRRQRQAIELCLVQNMKESEAAVQMGVSVTNPVSMYATSGMEKLIALAQDGRLPKYRELVPEGRDGHA